MPTKRVNATTMKKTGSNKSTGRSSDELRGQYEFDYTNARANRFADRMSADTRAVILDPDVAKVFTTPESVSAVPRALIETMPREG